MKMFEKSARVISSNMFHFLLHLSTGIGIVEGEEAFKAKPMKGETRSRLAEGGSSKGRKKMAKQARKFVHFLKIYDSCKAKTTFVTNALYS